MGLEWGAGLRWIEALRAAADPHGVMVRGALSCTETPVAPRFSLPDGPRIDATSRLLWCPVSTPLAQAQRLAAREGFTLDVDGDGDGALGDAVSAALGKPTADPADHLVAGFSARLPDGAAAWWLPAPRRATGPDPLTLPLRDRRFGALDALAVRVRGADEVGPRRACVVTAPEPRADAALQAWIDRAARAMAGEG
jgi:alkyldihydroxyacetonephosphate synthase